METSRLTQAHWAKARGSTSVMGIASGKLPFPMVSQSTGLQRWTDKRSSRRRRKNSIGKSRNTGTRPKRCDHLFLSRLSLPFQRFFPDVLRVYTRPNVSVTCAYYIYVLLNWKHLRGSNHHCKSSRGFPAVRTSTPVSVMLISRLE